MQHKLLYTILYYITLFVYVCMYTPDTHTHTHTHTQGAGAERAVLAEERCGLGAAQGPAGEQQGAD